MASKRPYVIALTGDHHLGGSTALCPPRVRLDDGGEYVASNGQQWIYHLWKEVYWPAVDKELKRTKGHFAAYLGGDCHESDHHHTMQLVSKNPEATAYIQDIVFNEIRVRRPKRIYAIRGTAAHAGASGNRDEAVARSLRATRHPDTGTWSAYEWKWVIYGVRFNARHHGRMGRLPWTQHGILHRVALEIEHEAHEDHEPVPDIALRSHNHRSGVTGKDNHRVNLIALPCWQLSTEYGYKVSEAPADIGGSIITVYPSGEYDEQHLWFRPEPSSADVVS